MAEVVRTRFLREFQRTLFPDNTFWRGRARADQGADQNEAIEIPQAATPVTSTFGTIQASQSNLDNANSLAPLVRLNDEKSYSISTFGTNPVALQLSDLQSLSYNKRQELFREHQEVIATDISNFCAIQWASNSGQNDNIIESTGGTSRANLVTGSSVNSVRPFTKNDIINVKRLFHRQNIMGMAGSLYALITPEQWDDLLKIDEFVDYDKTGRESKLREGLVGRLLGIEFLMPRHNDALNANVVYSGGAGANQLKLAFNGTVAAHKSAAVFWHSGFVRYAAGRGMLYERRNDPVFKSDIMSADARFGATKSRTDGKGVVTLVEAFVS